MAGKRLKFCMVSTFYPPYNFGGDGMHIYRLSNELARLGHEVDVFHCEDSYLLLNGEEPKGDFPNHPNVRVFGLRSRAGTLSPLLTQQTGVPFLKKALKERLEDTGYDVIHFNNMSLIGLSALGYGSPDAVRLYTTHEHWLICPMHVLWKYGREVCTGKDCLRCQIKGKRPPQIWRYTGLMDRMLPKVDCFLSPSVFTLNKHLEDGLDIPIVHMPYFLPDPKIAVGARTSQDTARPYFLFVGRLEKIKGVQNIIPVFRRRPEYDLVIAGDGEYRGELEGLAAGAENISFLGRVSQEELRELYSGARAVIVPSICYETFGIIVIEGFSCGTPAIVNDLGALPETIEQSGGGFVYGNEDELVDAMDRLASDPRLRKEMGDSGYSAYLKYWNETAHLEKYLGLVDDLMEKRKGVPAEAVAKPAAERASVV